jgi:hypothetical protein
MAGEGEDERDEQEDVGSREGELAGRNVSASSEVSAEMLSLPLSL